MRRIGIVFVWVAVIALVFASYSQREWQPMKDFFEWAGNAGVAAYIGFLLLIAIPLTAYLWRKDAAKNSLQNGGPVTPKSELRLGLMTEYGTFGDATTAGFPSDLSTGNRRLLNLQISFNPDADMVIERMRIEVAGERCDAVNWVTLHVDGINGMGTYFDVDKITAGKHDVRIEGYAKGTWWRSEKAYPFEFPRR